MAQARRGNGRLLRVQATLVCRQDGNSLGSKSFNHFWDTGSRQDVGTRHKAIAVKIATIKRATQPG